ncbi:box C/D snoRNA protein 1 [Myripristis murdjan]|uniref:Box C/D snoRNA protein 1 n=1 Tax=Myripristis murdjan TaxID=586833 RepID=A0A668ACS0_9TELE|nr:box C/D snoRNA protein 1 [Myripristis murdjan]
MCSVIDTITIMSAVDSQVENSSVEDEAKGRKRKISLSNCGVCGSEEAKYRCPACLRHSCSLLCVKKHKEDSGCSGVRNKTAFVALSQFDQMTLLSDYRFLEDTGRFSDGASRDALIRTPHATFKAKRLASNARKMNITLRFLPVTFTKSRENSTFFLIKQNQFLWHLKFIFPQSSTEFSQRRVPDTETLEQILTPYIHPTESDPVKRQKLKMYVHAPFDHIKVFMKAEGRKANAVRYHELDIKKSLRDNLSYKTLIEYPVLHVVVRDHWQDYPLKGTGEPASTCNSFATKTQGVDQGKSKLTHAPGPKPGSCTPEEISSWTGMQETSAETEPPKEKRAKRETGEEDLEEGEIIDSSEEEEKEEEEGNIEEDTLENKSCIGGDNSKGPANVINDMRATKDELLHTAGDDDDDEDDDDDASVSKHNTSRKDQCLSEHISVSADDNGTVRESAEVSMTKEDAMKEPGPVHTHHCHDENESARAAEPCGQE